MTTEALPTVTAGRDDAILIIRRELHRRSGRAWSVTGGRGTGWGFITIQAPPARRVDGETTRRDADDLADLLGLARRLVGHQGTMTGYRSDSHSEYVDRARGLTPRAHGKRSNL